MPHTTSRLPRSFVAGLVALGMGGCVSVPRVEMDKASSARIAKVALLKVAPAPSPTVTNTGGAAVAFGLVGALVQVGVNSSHGKIYATAVGERTATLAPDMMAALADALAQGGYEVVTPETEIIVAEGGDDVDLSSVQTDADAILAVWFTRVGYVSPPGSTSYQPWVVVKARMVDARSRGDLYFKTFSAGYDMRVSNSVYIEGGERFRYGSFDDLMARATGSVDGLFSATRAIATHVSADLARGETSPESTARQQ